MSILKVFGNVLLRIMCVVRCVKIGAIISMVFFSISIDILSCPVDCEFGALMIIFLMSSTVGIGIVNVFVFLGYICFSTSTGLTGIFGICSLSFFIVSI